jgi:hypothetical protein
LEFRSGTETDRSSLPKVRSEHTVSVPVLFSKLFDLMTSRLACQREQGKITPLFTIENEQLARHGTLLRRQKTPPRIWDGFKMKYQGSNTEKFVA